MHGLAVLLACSYQSLTSRFFKLMPSPKWKLVVDVGEDEESVRVSSTTTATSTAADPATALSNVSNNNADETKEESALSSQAAASDATPSMARAADMGPDSAAPAVARDPRVDDVLSILAEFMPSDAQSSWGPFLPGFMSLRLLLLRQVRSRDEDEVVRTMLDFFSSYSASGRQRADISVMLARDFIFLSQQQQHQLPFLSLDGNVMAQPHGQGASSTNSVFPLFSLPLSNSNFQNSPALAPIQGSSDSMSVVSN